MSRAHAEPTGGYKRYVLCILTLVYTLNYLDRGLITLLLPQIQTDLKLSDTQLGFLTGIAFGLFCATIGVPMARWSDRGDRSTVTSLAIGLWGLTVMGCVLVMNFWQFVVARVAAAVGEAGCMPPTYSLVGDYFPQPGERTRAMSFYMLANPLSVLLSFVLGGWLASRLGWRVTFFLMGLPALFVAVLVKWTVRDPRALRAHVAVIGTPRQPWHGVLAGLWLDRPTRHLTAALIVLLTIGAGLGPWYATFLTRYHGLGTEQLGYWLGFIFSVGGIAGIALGGDLSTRWFAQNLAGQMTMIAIAVACLTPAFTLFLTAHDTRIALGALAVLWTLFNFALGPTFALLQRLVSADARATSLALIMMLANLIGMGIGPQLVGLFSDLFRPAFGSESLRYAMLTPAAAAIWSAYHFWRAGKYASLRLETVAIR